MSKVVFDGVGEQPELNRITAKKNYASSSQSHKMGATAMFNDILHHLAKEKYPELLNEVGGLVAVRQHPVYAFQKIPIEGTDQYTHKFIGLFTVGADKGDKNFFGFSDSEIKKTAIRLEGVDHIKGVGFNYPWEVNGVKKIRYNAAKEALCIVTDSDPTKWIAIFEQSMAGVAETEAEIDAYLAEKWQPAFECAYYNNPLIVGVDMTLAEINANIEAFGNLRRNDDRPYSMCEFWIDGEYDVYYLDKETNRYEKNGINILTDLGITEGEIAGLTIEEKNVLFIQKRVERFREQAKEYFNVTDSIYQLMFLFIILATDNFEKNMYPYLMALLWRFLQDDLDSIFSTDNQGLDTKKYSTELHDFTDNSKSAYVFKGEDSAFWQLIELAFSNECKQMGRDILQAMYDKASGGTTTTEKLLCFFDDYFFDRAQNYFTPSAYNDDTEYAYEEAWNNKEYVSSVDIHPLAQALGSHESTERAWLEKRIIYLQSKFSFGSFASSGSDLGVISFRTQQAQSFTLTPAIDCYPTIVSGDGNVINAKQRVMAGESVTLEGAGGSNTNVYIVGADWLSDIGDLKGLALDPSAVQKLSISSKRLRRIKVGDEVASEVTSALQQLDIQRCDCLETIDARNLTSLVGVVDLSKCPRLSEAYFGGSSASAIVIAAGSKIEKLELPDTISVLDLRDTKFLQEINIGELANLNSLRLEGVPSLDGFEVLSNAYNAEGQKLQSIRLIGFTREGNSDDLDMLSNLANDKDKDGNEHPYNGIDAQGKPTDGHPVLEGTLNIDGYVYEDAAEAVKAAFPSIVFTPKGFYVRFADPEVQRICAENWGDGKGITTEQVKAITDIGTKFSGNTLIETFDEFEKFEGVTELKNDGGFYGCKKLNNIKLPPYITALRNRTLQDTLIKTLDIPDTVTLIGRTVFMNCTQLEEVEFPEAIDVVDQYCLYNCIKLKNFVVQKNVKTIFPNGLSNCKSLQYLVLKPTIPPTIYTDSISNTNNCPIYVPDASVEAYQSATNWVNYKDRIKSMFYYLGYIDFVDPAVRDICVANFDTDGDGKISIEEAAAVTDIGTLFKGNTEITSFNEFKHFTGVTTTKDSTFYNCRKLKSIIIPSSITSMGSLPFGDTAIEELTIPRTLVKENRLLHGMQVLRKLRLDIPVEVKASGSGLDVYLCKSLVEIIVPEDNPVMCSYNNSVYNKNRTKLLITPCIENYNIDWSGVTEIADEALDLYTLKNKVIDIPSSVITLPTGKAIAHYNNPCEKCIIRGNVGAISFTFVGFSNVKNIEFSFVGDGSESISFGRLTFGNCKNLESLIIQCAKLCEMTSSENITGSKIANGTGYIYVPDYLVDAYKAATNWNAYASQIKGISEMSLSFEDSVVEEYMLSNFDADNDNAITVAEAQSVNTFNIPTGARYFDEFKYFTGITKVTQNMIPITIERLEIPESVTELSYKAFENHVNIGDWFDFKNVTKFGQDACRNTGFENLVLPNITSIYGDGNDVFADCAKLKTVTFKGTPPKLSETFANCPLLENFYVSDDNKDYVVVDNSVYNAAMTEYYLTMINNEEIIIPEGVKTIMYRLGRYMPSLRRILLPSTITDIKNKFIGNNSPKFNTLIINAPQVLEYRNTIDAPQFTNGAGSIYVPDDLVEDYKVATNWIQFADRIKGLNEYGPLYVTIVNGVTLNSNGTTSANNKMSTVGFIPTNGATNITFGVTGGTLGNLCEYKDDETFVDYWSPMSNPRTVTLNKNSTKLKASFSTADLTNAYIMNVDTEEYLWKGSNV